MRRAVARSPHELRLDVVLYDAHGRPLLVVVKHRSSRTRVDVQASGGGPVGSVEKSGGVLRKTYQAKDAWGHIVGEIREQKPTRTEPHYWALLCAPDGSAVGRITQRTETRPGAVLAGLARNHRTWWELDLGAVCGEPLRTLAVALLTVIGAVTGRDGGHIGFGDVAGQVLPT
ncbi:hypothetical protein ACU686_03805 [Yinghuangia aomiensis]